MFGVSVGKISAVAVTNQNPIRVAVLGTGSLGQHHARLYAEMAAAGVVTFAGVFDARPEAARTFAEKFNVRAFNSIEETTEASDALNIVTPTTTHFAIAKSLLERGKHLLIEKPMTDDMAQARELVELARRRGCLIQVGHIERFNPAFQFLESMIPAPRLIEAQRLSPHPGRGADVGVVLDLMIHDLDLALALAKSPVARVEAAGLAVLSPSEDIAEARITFANGCAAHLTASRVSDERRRTLRVFGDGAAHSVAVDLRAQEGFVYRLAPDGETPTAEAVVTSEFAGTKILRAPAAIAKAEPLKLELEHFAACVREQRPPLVDGEAAIRALELAFEITRQIGAKQ